MVITRNDIYGSNDSYLVPVTPFLVGPPINRTGGRFTTRTGLYASILSFVHITTVWWSAPSLIIDGCDTKKTSVDASPTSLFLHNFVALFYCDRISHSHIILSGWCHIMNWYCKNSARHLCTTWVTLNSDSKNFCIPLQYESTVNSDAHKYFLNFPMSRITVDAFPTKLCLEFYSGDTVDLEMK